MIRYVLNEPCKLWFGRSEPECIFIHPTIHPHFFSTVVQQS